MLRRAIAQHRPKLIVCYGSSEKRFASLIAPAPFENVPNSAFKSAYQDGMCVLLVPHFAQWYGAFPTTDFLNCAIGAAALAGIQLPLEVSPGCGMDTRIGSLTSQTVKVSPTPLSMGTSMAQTYLQIQRQIEALQRQAEKLKGAEVAGVISRIRVAIEHYGLTAEQLGLGGGKSSTARAARGTTKKSGGAVKSAAAYADDKGNSWGGRGPRPKWLRDAIAGGRTLEEFATRAETASGTTAKAKKQRPVASKRKATSYRDDAGNSWSGFGPKPGWLKDALTAGKTLEDLASLAKS